MTFPDYIQQSVIGIYVMGSDIDLKFLSMISSVYAKCPFFGLTYICYFYFKFWLQEERCM